MKNNEKLYKELRSFIWTLDYEEDYLEHVQDKLENNKIIKEQLAEIDNLINSHHEQINTATQIYSKYCSKIFNGQFNELLFSELHEFKKQFYRDITDNCYADQLENLMAEREKIDEILTVIIVNNISHADLEVFLQTVEKKYPNVNTVEDYQFLKRVEKVKIELLIPDEDCNKLSYLFDLKCVLIEKLKAILSLKSYIDTYLKYSDDDERYLDEHERYVKNYGKK